MVYKRFELDILEFLILAVLLFLAVMYAFDPLDIVDVVPEKQFQGFQEGCAEWENETKCIMKGFEERIYEPLKSLPMGKCTGSSVENYFENHWFHNIDDGENIKDIKCVAYARISKSNSIDDEGMIVSEEYCFAEVLCDYSVCEIEEVCTKPICQLPCNGTPEYCNEKYGIDITPKLFYNETHYGWEKYIGFQCDEWRLHGVIIEEDIIYDEKLFEWDKVYNKPDFGEVIEGVSFYFTCIHSTLTCNGTVEECNRRYGL